MLESERRRNQRQHRPRASRGVERQSRPDIAATAGNARVASSSYRRVDGDPTDRTVTGTVAEVKRECIWIETEGSRAKLYASELMLDIGEVPTDRYTPGDHFEAFVFEMEPDPESGAAQFSIRRAAPYLDALDDLDVGTVVAKATVVNTYDLGLELDVDGLRGNALFWEIPLTGDESPHSRYQPGDIVNDLLLDEVDRDTRSLSLSVRRNAPGYVEQLDTYSVGDIVSGIVTYVFGDRGLWLDVGDIVGWVGPQELRTMEDESVHERYSVGDTVSNLFVRQVDRDTRSLALSVRRNAPGYVDALDTYSVGDIVTGTITAFQGNGGLWLDVGGVVGGVAPRDLAISSDESSYDHYAVGQTVANLFVWQVTDRRSLSLSIRRCASGYIEALADISVGAALNGIVAEANEWGIWLHIAKTLAWIPISELQLDDGVSPPEHYARGDSVKARVWQIDVASRAIILSVRRLDPDFSDDPIVRGATIDAMVKGTPKRGDRVPIRVLADSTDVVIPPNELSLSTATPRRFPDSEGIRVVVVSLNDAGKPEALSHRRALDHWDAEVQRLQPGVLVARARVLPREGTLDTEDRLAVDLGPITGFIVGDELDRDDVMHQMTYGVNELYPVVVESVDATIDGTTIVSRDKFDARWAELAKAVMEGEEIEAELREVDGRVALLDLGSGLLAEMPVEQLPARTEGVAAEQGRIGETVTVQIKSIEAATYTITAEIKNYDLVQMIAADETLVCELKAVFLASAQSESTSERQENHRDVVRAMAGMMNRDGGHVIVGVEDTDKKDGDVVGWEASGWENPNAMKTELANQVGRLLGPAAGGLYDLRFETLPDGHEILDIVCKPAGEPIFLSYGDIQEFPVRYPAMTKKLKAREQHHHVQQRFYGRGTG